MYAEFDESLVTGNEMIDGQHKELIDKINKLVACCEQAEASYTRSRVLTICPIIQNFISAQRRSSRKRFPIRALKNTGNSTRI